MEKFGSFRGRKKKKNGTANNTVMESRSSEEELNVNETTTTTTTTTATATSPEKLEMIIDIDISFLKSSSQEIDLFISQYSQSSLPMVPPENVEIFVKLVDSLIEKYEFGESATKFGQIPQNDLAFLQSLTQISKLTNFSTTTQSSFLNRATNVLQRSMSILEHEFRTLLQDKSAAADHCDAVAGYEKQFQPYSPESVSNMNRIANAMISSGYETECRQVYITIRTNKIIKEALRFQTRTIEEVQNMHWELLEAVIATWINVIKQCCTLIFPGEQRFCDEVFSEYPFISHSLYIDLVRNVITTQLVNFAEAVAMTKRAAEKLFKFLDMHEALRDLMKFIEGLNLEQQITSEISGAANHLGEAAMNIFCELENSIKRDNGSQPVPSGVVHPLTRYTMNYLKYACDEYRNTLEHVFQQHTQPIENHLESSDDHDSIIMHSPFAKQFINVMDLLDLNLDSKSKIYRDPSLRYIFLMNNGRYILQKIKGSTEICELVGNTWSRKRSFDLRQYHKNYQRETWGRLLGCLTHEGIQVNGKVSKPVLKERFKSFNAMFDEIHKTQSMWLVSEEQLQSELRVSISAVVIPAYRAFLGRFHQHLEGGKQSERYIKYQPDDIERLVDDLFEGHHPTSITKKKSS